MNKLFLLFLLMQFSFSAGPPQPDLVNIQGIIVELRTGWNLISSPTNIAFDTSKIKNVDNGTLWLFSDNKWSKSYGASIPPGQGFWVKMTKDENVPFERKSGHLINQIKVQDGWNLIGMSLDSYRVNDIFRIFQASMLWEFQYSDKENRYIWKDRASTHRGSIHEGRGFWLKK